MKKDISFEEAMLLLDEAVKRLEGGSLSLDESLAEYEKAVGLVKICNGKIEKAKRKVQILTSGVDGEVTDKPFDEVENEA
jgi:exodeoxyribonuclease VII small subunit